MTQSQAHKAAAALITLLYMIHCHCEGHLNVCTKYADTATHLLLSQRSWEAKCLLSFWCHCFHFVITWLLGISRHSISKCKTCKWNVFVRTMKCKKKQEQRWRAERFYDEPGAIARNWVEPTPTPSKQSNLGFNSVGERETYRFPSETKNQENFYLRRNRLLLSPFTGLDAA